MTDVCHNTFFYFIYCHHDIKLLNRPRHKLNGRHCSIMWRIFISTVACNVSIFTITSMVFIYLKGIYLAAFLSTIIICITINVLLFLLSCPVIIYLIYKVCTHNLCREHCEKSFFLGCWVRAFGDLRMIHFCNYLWEAKDNPTLKVLTIPEEVKNDQPYPLNITELSTAIETSLLLLLLILFGTSTLCHWICWFLENTEPRLFFLPFQRSPHLPASCRGSVLTLGRLTFEWKVLVLPWFSFHWLGYFLKLHYHMALPAACLCLGPHQQQFMAAFSLLVYFQYLHLSISNRPVTVLCWL